MVAAKQKIVGGFSRFNLIIAVGILDQYYIHGQDNEYGQKAPKSDHELNIQIPSGYLEQRNDDNYHQSGTR